MTREHQFVRFAARGLVDPAARCDITGVDASLDWSAVFDIASAHRLTPAIAGALHGLAPGLLPEWVTQTIDDRMIAVTARNLAVVSLMRAALETLDASGVRAAVAARPAAVLMTSLGRGYEFHRARLLVMPEDLTRASDALVAAGHLVVPSGSHDTAGFYAHGRTEVRLTLETSVADPILGATFPVAGAVERAIAVQVFGGTLRVLARDDQLLSLCARAAAREWGRLDEIAAIAALCRQVDDPGEALRLARLNGLRRAVLMGARLAHDLLGVETALARRAARSIPVRSVATLAAGTIANHVRRTRFRTALMRFMIRDGLRSHLRYAAHATRHTQLERPLQRADSPAPVPAPARPPGHDTTGEPRKLVLRQFQSPGDLVMLTAAVRDLHLLYPGRFVTDVRTPCPDLWQHNPHVTPLDDRDPGVEILECEYPLIHRSNQTPVHFIYGFMEFLNERLGLQMKPTAFKGDIHLSSWDRMRPSQLSGLIGPDEPFWIVAAGGKYDYTIKWWSHARYQAVVDRFSGRLRFVQVGEADHHHPPLDGVVDLRGKTSLRDLIRLIYHADGVLGPVSLPMHLAAAVETRPGASALRPCVVIAGGREPVHWEAYPGHQFLHTIGALQCCDTGGCWRSRTLPLGDGDGKDEAGQLCLDVVDGLPRCMDLVTAEEVTRRIELYLRRTGSVHAPAEQRATTADSSAGSVSTNRDGVSRQLPVWYETYPPREPSNQPPVTIGVLATADRGEMARLCLNTIRANCPRSRYNLVVGLNAVSNEMRHDMYTRRLAGEIDRLWESPVDVGVTEMQRRMFADAGTEHAWWLENHTALVDSGAFERQLAVARSAGTDTVVCDDGWLCRTTVFHEDRLGRERDAVSEERAASNECQTRHGSEDKGISDATAGAADHGPSLRPRALVCEPDRDGVLLSERIDRMRPRRVLLSFRHGLGDLIMFLAPFEALKAQYPGTTFILGVPHGRTYETILDPESAMVVNDEVAERGLDQLPFDLVAKLHFPMSESQQTYTKAEWCCLHELGVPPVAGHRPIRPQANRLVAVHLHSTCLPGVAGADRDTAERVWDDILAAGCIPLETHFEHAFHNPVNRKFDFVDASVRRCRPEVSSLVGLLQACGAFVGVVSGNFHVALSVLPPQRVFLLERDFRRASFTKLPIATADMRNYRGEVRVWLESLTSNRHHGL